MQPGQGWTTSDCHVKSDEIDRMPSALGWQARRRPRVGATHAALFRLQEETVFHFDLSTGAAGR
jgi:formate dehydrogenase assembly factor FdhD